MEVKFARQFYKSAESALLGAESSAKITKFALQPRQSEMYLEDFVEIIGGKQCSATHTPLINNVVVRAECILRGDAFILRNLADLDEAINRGAYAIVSEKFYEIQDSEVAFILVENLHSALERFAKYIKLTNGIEIFALEAIDFTLTRAISRDKNIAFARDIFELVEALHFHIIFIDFEVLFFETESIKNTRNLLFKILYQTLFELKIEFENQSFELILPSIFTSNLNDILYFFKMRHIDFKLSFDENLFLPTFINTSAQSVKYGQSMRFIYATKNKNLFKKYMEFMQSASWGRMLILVDSALDFETNLEVKIYKNNDELLQYFKMEKYHFFAVYGLEQCEIELRADFIEQSLF